jgi:AcrR family transcriptional regulator
MPDTKDRILDAAERLFGEFGYDATSLRAITAEAGVNIAAVNYHFKSKEGLLRAVLTRRIRPINEQRFAMLSAYEEARGSGPPRVEDLVRILLTPMMAVGAGPEAVGLRMLIGRMYSEPSRNIHHMFFQEMKEVVWRFAAAFQRALSSMPVAEVYWRIHFLIGAAAHTLAGTALLETFSGGLCDPNDSAGAIDRLVAFVVGGLKAPLPANLSKGGSRASAPEHAAHGKTNRIRNSPR